MIEEPHIWRVWAQSLQSWGLRSFAAWLLEATSPVHLIGAQLVYVGQPLLGVFFSQEYVRSAAEMLERPDATRAFVSYLLEDVSS